MKRMRVRSIALAMWMTMGVSAYAQGVPVEDIPALDARAAVPTATTFAYPQSIFVDSQNGNLWVADFDNNRVMRFDVSSLTGVRDTPVASRPETYALGQNYPNPFNPTTLIQFTIVDRQSASVRVYDLLGREVAMLVNEDKGPGTYTVSFSGEGLASGMYFYRLQAGSFVATRKMILMK